LWEVSWRIREAPLNKNALKALSGTGDTRPHFQKPSPTPKKRKKKKLNPKLTTKANLQNLTDLRQPVGMGRTGAL
jgi:hypothetical protein